MLPMVKLVEDHCRQVSGSRLHRIQKEIAQTLGTPRATGVDFDNVISLERNVFLLTLSDCVVIYLQVFRAPARLPTNNDLVGLSLSGRASRHQYGVGQRQTVFVGHLARLHHSARNVNGFTFGYDHYVSRSDKRISLFEAALYVT